MPPTIESYEDVTVDGVMIQSRLVMKGTEKDWWELYEIKGNKTGVFRGKRGHWARGAYYDPARFNYEEAMTHWQELNLPKFSEVTN